MNRLKIALDDLKLAVKSNSISIRQVAYWLNEYEGLYNEQISIYSCSIHEPKLPCFCQKRRADCLFIDLYREFKKLKSIINREEKFGYLFQEYRLLEQNGLDLDMWNKQIEKIIDNLKINEKGIFIRLNNGKENESYRKIILIIPKSNFVYHNILSSITNSES